MGAASAEDAIKARTKVLRVKCIQVDTNLAAAGIAEAIEDKTVVFDASGLGTRKCP